VILIPGRFYGNALMDGEAAIAEMDQGIWKAPDSRNEGLDMDDLVERDQGVLGSGSTNVKGQRASEDRGRMLVQGVMSTWIAWSENIIMKWAWHLYLLCIYDYCFVATMGHSRLKNGARAAMILLSVKRVTSLSS